MAAPEDEGVRVACPILLLKTRSSPSDTYEEFFKDPENGSFEPEFLPVLQHQFFDDMITWLTQTILAGSFAMANTSEKRGRMSFGGLIFTSQRAVEAFMEAVSTIERSLLASLLPAECPLYVVGPATARAVRAIDLVCPVIGEHTGNGDALSDFILEDYARIDPSGQRLPLLFMVGEQRRDIIPNKLQSNKLTPDRRITVIEKVVYGTKEREAFADSFSSVLKVRQLRPGDIWVVVFSPQGCGAMLRVLGWVDSTGKHNGSGEGSRFQTTGKVRIATIGPTTRDYLEKQYHFEPDVCADHPSPRGVHQGIVNYCRSHDIDAMYCK